MQLTDEGLSKEEWEAINKLLSYQPAEDLMPHSGKDLQSMIRFMATVSISQAAARIININQTEIICGRFEQLHVSAKFKHRSTHCDVRLRFYGLSAPEGSIAQVCLLSMFELFISERCLVDDNQRFKMNTQEKFILTF